MPETRPPAAGVVLWSQLRYQIRRSLRAPRAVSTGMVLPIVLLVLANPDPNAAVARVAGLTMLGSGMTAWTTHGIGLVATREAGELRRWWATPTPRGCYLAARIAASVCVAALGGLATVAVGALGWGVRFDVPHALGTVAILGIGATAWAAPATAMTRFVSSVDTAWPVLGLSYLPIVLTSGALGGGVSWPWLRDVGALLPARPMTDALAAMLGAGSARFADVLVLVAWALGGLAVATATFRWDPTPPKDRA